MTRFQKEISGELGAYWQKNAIEESEKAVKRADEGATIESDGAIRWNSNGNYIPDDFCEMLEYQGYPFSREATRAKREEQNTAFLDEYRERSKIATDSQEILSEMRAAFGVGTTVVDVITGKKITI